MKSSTNQNWSLFTAGRPADAVLVWHRLETATVQSVSHCSDREALREMESRGSAEVASLSPARQPKTTPPHHSLGLGQDT
jgi:hypothetical protein